MMAKTVYDFQLFNISSFPAFLYNGRTLSNMNLSAYGVVHPINIIVLIISL